MADQQASPRSTRPTGLAFVGASLAAFAMYVSSTIGPPDPAPAVPSAPTTAGQNQPAVAEAKQAVSREVQRAVFFSDQVEPQLAQADALNREAAQRCITRIGDMMDKYRRGVDPFVEDLTSMSTRFGIVKRMPADWWKEDNRVESFVEEKFERYLFSEETLLRDITGVLDDFKSEIDANQRRMLISVKTALSAADLPEVDAQEYEPFFESVSGQLQRYSTKQGTASVRNAVGVFVISETAGTLAGRAVVVGLLARFGSSAAVGAAAGAGATATTTAAGTGTGAFGGPAGAAVGFGIGMAVGLVIDWWMTEQFEVQMSDQMDGYLDSLEQTILFGGAVDGPPNTNLKPESFGSQNAKSGSGLVDALPVVCDRLLEAYRERFYEQIVPDGAPPNESRLTFPNRRHPGCPVRHLFVHPIAWAATGNGWSRCTSLLCRWQSGEEVLWQTGRRRSSRIHGQTRRP